MVGKFIYLIISRPDIANAVSTVNKLMQVPKHAHMVARKGIFWYAECTIDVGFMYTNDKISLELYSDVDWVGDKASRKSTSGMMYSFDCVAMSWLSRKQPTITLSPREANYRVVAQAICEVVCTMDRHVAQRLGIYYKKDDSNIWW